MRWEKRIMGNKGRVRSMDKERIISAAVMKDGEIWAGKRHGELIVLAYLKTGKRIMSKDQGFLVSGNRFVSREEAKGIAKRAGQISKDFEGVLMSENLW